jgi:hypothetical protein
MKSIPMVLWMGFAMAQQKPPVVSPEVSADGRISFRLIAAKATEVTVQGDLPEGRVGRRDAPVRGVHSAIVWGGQTVSGALSVARIGRHGDRTVDDRESESDSRWLDRVGQSAADAGGDQRARNNELFTKDLMTEVIPAVKKIYRVSKKPAHRAMAEAFESQYAPLVKDGAAVTCG